MPEDRDRCIVIGSGPSGIAAAKALLARGRTVVMLDGGKAPEPAAEARRVALAATGPEGWSAADRAAWMAPQYGAPPGQVRRFGSDFAMEPAATTFADAPGWLGLRASRAAGGFSNVWGAAVLPYRQADMADWPISADDLAPHYRAVAGFVPISGRTDDIEALMPALPMAGHGPIAPATQAEALLARLSAERKRFAAQGLRAGIARQAVDAACRRCGMCLHGCPYGLIWSARLTLADLGADPRFSYRSGAVVTRFEEGDAGIALYLEDGTTITGTRAFLGAGVLETARILLASRPEPGELVLKDSQHAFLPMLQRFPNRSRPDRGAFHTLPQIFLELEAPEISAYLVHAQIYSWNDYYARDLVANYGHGLPFARAFFAALARRLIVAQVFLHSDHSHRIGLTRAADGRLTARLIANADTDRTVRAAARRIGAAMGHAGLLPLTFASRPGAPGSSFHVGGSVPMARTPAPGQSDLLGRPHGLSRLHVIDASVLPAIPATTITLPVMANAHRIAALAP
ncbi:GMC oxidoreductase [Defluviimonas sp. WL0024]|uniref:GMC oxidoreductase n=1 Tax=Albidovulum salinarum TaxID=2984153 RepID=A0ABT2X6M2_9RHOB|nr:GMC oxidoreductase [Defluviimonas sp. WL0024]MCU9849598.1 GMC oxidoreductase [Defluviimonas sp. WL0024]